MSKGKNWHGVLDELYDKGKEQTQSADTNHTQQDQAQNTDTTQQHNTQTQSSDTKKQHNFDAVPARALPGNAERRNQRVQLCFKPSTHRKLTALAHSTGISLNNLVNSILEDHIEKHNL